MNKKNITKKTTTNSSVALDIKNNLLKDTFSASAEFTN